MKGLVAEAYQLKLGKNQSNMLKGDKAITALTDAMKKGSVKTAELIPFLDALMRRDAAPGLAQARQSSIAGENRFGNEKDRFWDNFNKGGGESGVKKFWDMAAGMMTWFADNGASLGRAFETSIYWLDAFKAGVYELSQFISTGEHNSFTDWARNLGVDVDVIRESLLRLRDSVLKLLGIDSNNVGTILETIIDRLIVFINRLQEIANGATRVVNGVGQIKEATIDKNQAYTGGSIWDKTKMFTEEALRNVAALTPFGRIVNANKPTVFGGIGDILGGTKDATSAAAGSLLDLGIGSGGKPVSLPPSIPSWKPDGWGTTASDIGTTGRSDYTPQQVNHSVKLEVTGNAEMISALMDEKTRTQLPILLSGEIAKAVVGAPKRD